MTEWIRPNDFPGSGSLTEDGLAAINRFRETFEKESYEVSGTTESVANAVNWLVRRGEIDEQQREDAAIMITIYITSVRESAQWN